MESEKKSKKLIVKFEKMLAEETNIFFDLYDYEDLIEHYLQTSKIKKGLLTTKIALKNYPKSVFILLKRAQLLILVNKIKEAEKTLKKAEIIGSNKHEVLLVKSMIYSKIKNHKKAIETLKNIFKKQPNSFDVNLLLANEYQQVKNYKKAIKHYKVILEKYPAEEELIYCICSCYLKLASEKKGINFLLKYINSNPYSDTAWYHLSIFYSDLNQYKKALWAIEFATIIDNSFYAAHFEKALIEKKLKLYSEAIASFLKIVNNTKQKNNAHLYYEIGECYLKLDKLKLAESYFLKAIKCNKKMHESWEKIAVLYGKTNRYFEGLHFIKEAVKIKPQNINYQFILAQFNHKVGFIDEAIIIYNKLIKHQDIDANVFIKYADLLIDNKLNLKAISLLKKGIEKYPLNSNITYHLAAIFILNNNINEGIDLLEKAKKLNSNYYTKFKSTFPLVEKIINKDKSK